MSAEAMKEGRAAMDAYDNAALAMSILGWLEAISEAMEDAAQNTTHDRRDQIKELASLSKYLCADWHNHFDCLAEDLAKKHGFNHS
jgi:hypothetical protein|tara:strand:- start:1642 stop:1899 length:258 start_codon:yes stop_codon:yes gene_type:complete